MKPIIETLLLKERYIHIFIYYIIDKGSSTKVKVLMDSAFFPKYIISSENVYYYAIHICVPNSGSLASALYKLRDSPEISAARYTNMNGKVYQTMLI